MRKKRSLPLLLLCIISFITLVGMFFFVSPASTVSLVGMNVPNIVFFFPILFIFVYSLLTFFLQRKTHGLLTAIFVVLYLILRLNGFTHILFFLLIAALFLICELFFSKRN